MCVAIWVSWNFEPFVQSSNHFVAFWHTRHKPLHAGKCFHQMAVVVALSRYVPWFIFVCQLCQTNFMAEKTPLLSNQI